MQSRMPTATQRRGANRVKGSREFARTRRSQKTKSWRTDRTSAALHSGNKRITHCVSGFYNRRNSNDVFWWRWKPEYFYFHQILSWYIMIKIIYRKQRLKKKTLTHTIQRSDWSIQDPIDFYEILFDLLPVRYIPKRCFKALWWTLYCPSCKPSRFPCYKFTLTRSIIIFRT